jgi:hypothetical protein
MPYDDAAADVAREDRAYWDDLYDQDPAEGDDQ